MDTSACIQDIVESMEEHGITFADPGIALHLLLAITGLLNAPIDYISTQAMQKIVVFPVSLLNYSILQTLVYPIVSTPLLHSLHPTHLGLLITRRHREARSRYRELQVDTNEHSPE